MKRPSTGELIIILIFTLLFLSTICSGVVEDCEFNERACARCEYILSTTDWLGGLLERMVEKVDGI